MEKAYDLILHPPYHVRMLEMSERDPKQVEKILERVERFKKQQGERVLEVIERQREQAEKGRLNFTAPTEEQLKRKLDNINTPMIIFQSWNPNTPTPGTINYNVGIYNPDPFQHIWLFVHLFIGPANIVLDVGEALGTVDTRFPRLTLPKFDGLSIGPGDTQTLNFKIPIPANIESSNYQGNSFLFLADWHDVGDHLDRSIFVFEIT